MSVFSDGCLDITTEGGGLQDRLERGISPESRVTIEQILASVSRLSNVEKLYLYLRLPTYVPAVSTTAECNRTSSDTESVTVTWMRTHLARNDKTSLLRQKVYDDYRMFCESHQQSPVSVSDFKKILLSVFPELTTRRLGSRGNAKHMFGGISYLMQPNTYTVPKIKVEDNNQTPFCDGAAACTKDDRECREEERAAGRLILEWAYKLLSISFESIQDLAIHLISKSYVSQVSKEAFTVTAGTNCQANYKDTPEEIPVEDTALRQVDARHQLQRKLQERREITRQKQRMEEERTHLATQESGGTSTKRNPGVSRTPVPKLDSDSRVPRRPSVPTILPKTLLPKLQANIPRNVDTPQFILLSSPGSASQLQPGRFANSLVFISSSLGQVVPSLDARIPVQGVVKNLGVATQEVLRPAWIDLPRSDLTVVTTSSVAAPILAVGGYSSQLRPVEAGVKFPSSMERNRNPDGVGVVVQPICTVAGGQRGNQFGNVGETSGLVGDVPKPADSQEVGSISLSAVGRSSVPPVHELTMPQTSVGSEPTCADKASDSNGFVDDCVGIEDVLTKASNDNDVSQNSGAQVSFQTSTRPTNLAAQGSNPPIPKGRGRSAPSRSSTKTVSSILDEQRCSLSGAAGGGGGGGSRATKLLYNDSRNVSQILKELREKGCCADSEQGSGGVSVVLDFDQRTPAVPTPFVGVVPPSPFQLVQVLPSCSEFKSTDKIVQLGTKSSTSQLVHDSSALEGLNGEIRSPVRRQQASGVLPDVFQSSQSVVLSMSSLVTTQNNPVFKSTSSSFFSFLDSPVVAAKSGCSLPKNTLPGGMPPLPVNPKLGGRKSALDALCRNVLHVAVSTSGPETGRSASLVESRRPTTLPEGFKLLEVPVIMSTSESQSSSVQQVFLKPESSIQQSCNIALSEDKVTKPGRVNTSTDNNQVRSKRGIVEQNYSGIKRLLLGDDRPTDIVERFPAKAGYHAGRVDTGRGALVVDSLLSRLHSPGEESSHPMPYKDSTVQHCTLQQLSQASALRVLEHRARLWQMVESQSKQGSRPASAFGLGAQGTRPSRPNTVAGGSGCLLDDASLETDYPDATSYEESRGSERSTPMSPRSNLSGCSLYMDQSNAFMPIHITDSLPSVAAIKPLPTLGQRPPRVEIDSFGMSRPVDARSLAKNTADTRSFVPYTNAEQSRVSAAGGRSGGFAPVSSIRPLKKGATVPASRQRHHSAHDFQNSGNKVVQEEAYGTTTSVQLLPPVSMSSGSFGGSTASSMMPMVFDFQDLEETAGEVAEIISASLESSVGGAAALTSLQRSRSEPANCLQSSGPCTFDLEEMIDMLTGGADSSEKPGSAENLSSHGGSWSDCSDKRATAAEKLRDAPDNSPWSSSSRDRLISGVEMRPSLAFSNCDDLNPSNYGAYEHSSGAYIEEGCTPPLSQNSSPEFTSEMPLFDKPDKELEAFPPDGGQSTALDTPSSLEGLFGAICGDDNDNHRQTTNMDFTWPY